MRRWGRLPSPRRGLSCQLSREGRGFVADQMAIHHLPEKRQLPTSNPPGRLQSCSIRAVRPGDNRTPRLKLWIPAFAGWMGWEQIPLCGKTLQSSCQIPHLLQTNSTIQTLVLQRRVILQGNSWADFEAGNERVRVSRDERSVAEEEDLSVFSHNPSL